MAVSDSGKFETRIAEMMIKLKALDKGEFKVHLTDSSYQIPGNLKWPQWTRPLRRPHFR